MNTEPQKEVQFCPMCGSHPLEHDEFDTPQEALYKAAPELLEALQAFVRFHHCDTDGAAMALRQEAMRAISKALGNEGRGE